MMGWTFRNIECDFRSLFARHTTSAGRLWPMGFGTVRGTGVIKLAKKRLTIYINPVRTTPLTLPIIPPPFFPIRHARRLHS